jgi:glycosyltransferase involved in cell wall biosynthesis
VTRTVLHFGPDVREPGGMAHVIRSYVAANLEPWRAEAVSTYSARSRLHELRALVGGVVALLTRRGVAGVHMHASHRFDIVRTLLLLELARLRRLPRVVTLHGAEFMDEVRSRPRLARTMLRRAGAVTALSAEVEAAARGLGIENVTLLPNPVRARPAPTAVGRRTQVLFAGDIGRRKGVDVLLAAWPTVHEARPDVTLLLVGPPLEPALVASLPAGARYAGLVDFDGVAAELGRTCLAVLPSRAEAMPTFILEALAAGVPVVSTPVGSIESVVAGAGAIVPVEDADALAAAMVELLRSPERIDELSRAAQSKVAAEFSTEIFERRVRDLYAATFSSG